MIFMVTLSLVIGRLRYLRYERYLQQEIGLLEAVRSQELARRDTLREAVQEGQQNLEELKGRLLVSEQAVERVDTRIGILMAQLARTP
jgi:hypothetical protein